MSGVKLQNVSKVLGQSKVLDNLNLNIESGEFLTLLGPSGCGKSTTLNLLAGLLYPDEGEIYIGDRMVSNLTPDKRDLAMVFQNYALYPHMTIYENLAFPLRARGRKFNEEYIDKKINEVSQILGINEYLKRYPKELSGGQQQRVALGRAMVRDPKVFLLDEPLSNLDARLRIKMRKDIKALHERLQSTIIYVTHDQSEAMTLSDRIAILNKGVLQQIGTPDEIYNKPANMFVAGFVGDREINFINGVIIEQNGTIFFKHDMFQYELTDSSERYRGLKSCKVIMGMRGEDMIVSTAPKDNNSLAAEVHLTELIGADRILYVYIGGTFELWCRVDANVPVAKSQTVYLNFPIDKLCFFDSDTGEALFKEIHE